MDRETPTHARLASQLAADLSQYLVVNGAPAEAMEVALWATEVKPDSSAHWVQLGVACSSLSGATRSRCRQEASGQGIRASCENAWTTLMQRAVAATETALELDPKNETARTNLVRYLVNLQQHSAALEQLDAHGAMFSPGDEPAFRALIAANSGELIAAKQYCVEALMMNPHQDDAHSLLLQIAQRERAQGEFATSEATLKRLGTFRDSPAIRIELGILALQHGRAQDAYREFAHALSLDGRAQRAQFGLASLRIQALCFLEPFPPKSNDR